MKKLLITLFLVLFVISIFAETEVYVDASADTATADGTAENPPAHDYYVDAINGSNVTGDGTKANPWKTIQYTLNQIYEKDATVYVAAGTYKEQVIVQQIVEGIDLIGAGADVTTIDASSIIYNGGAIKLPPGEGFVVSGFTITGGMFEGYSGPGGAILGPDATVTVENNVIKNNLAWDVGGALYLGNNSVIRNNVIQENYTQYDNGAVYAKPGTVIEDNTFTGNYAGTGCGAIEAQSVSVIIRRNTFKNNRAGWLSTCKGGAFYGKGTVYNNLFIGNSANSYNQGYGGAAYVTGGTFINNTLVNNIGERKGDCSGVYCDGSVVVVNNIIVNGTDGVGIYVKAGSSVTADYNDIWNNDLGSYGGSAVPGSYDIHQDPLFVNPANNDYNLQALSPCIDAGTPDTTGLNISLIDMDGNFRIWDGDGDGTEIIDMGAYEYGAPVTIAEEDKDRTVPQTIHLYQNYPNPFNPATTISYELPKSSFVKLSICDIKGRLVETLVNEQKSAGYYSVEWNAENISSGVYFYWIDAGDFSSVKKCLVVK